MRFITCPLIKLVYRLKFLVALQYYDKGQVLASQLHGLAFTDFVYSLSGLNLLKGFGISSVLGMSLHQGKVTAATTGETSASGHIGKCNMAFF